MATPYDQLHQLLETKDRKSSRIVELSEKVLASSSLGDEKWLILEQTVSAALDCANFDLAQQYIQELEKEFPGSSRVMRLKGMFLEARGLLDEASSLYENILKQDPTNAAVLKRTIAILKAKGETVEAIVALNKYLETFMTDFEAWQELMDLYIEEADFEKACFCAEELILSNPHNFWTHLKYAELLYTIGGTANYNMAKRYFAMAIKLNPDSARANLGLYMSIIKTSGKGTKSTDTSVALNTTRQRLDAIFDISPNKVAWENMARHLEGDVSDIAAGTAAVSLDSK